MAEWLKAHAWKAALRLTRQAHAKINGHSRFTSGCGVYHSQSVRPSAMSLCGCSPDAKQLRHFPIELTALPLRKVGEKVSIRFGVVYR